MTEQSGDVLACPFCGNAGTRDPRHTYWTEGGKCRICCGQCGAHGPWQWARADGEAKALEAWNTRTALAQAPAPSGEAYSAMSWNGFNVFGDEKSIREVARTVHVAGTAPQLQDEIKRLRSGTPPPPEQAGPSGEALRYATQLAELLWKKHYATVAPHWKPLPDLLGVLSQIDNMVGVLASPGAMAEQKWPFAEGSGVTPAKVWAEYVRLSKLTQHQTKELANCAKRIHAQREEINRLASPGAMEGAQAAQPEPKP